MPTPRAQHPNVVYTPPAEGHVWVSVDTGKYVEPDEVMECMDREGDAERHDRACEAYGGAGCQWCRGHGYVTGYSTLFGYPVKQIPLAEARRTGALVA